jgi:oxygen-independent coproporphyrinogen-3 oxidase
MVAAIIREIALQKDYLQDKKVNSVYFGGGTPSLLSVDDIQRIFFEITRFFDLSPNAEITLEANPDDLTSTKIKALRQTPINRFSIGVQSFHDSDLEYMNRAHNGGEALYCIKAAQDSGFENLTIDLIYGTPTMNDDLWKYNIQTAIGLDIPHISCYALTVEPQTALDHFIKKGRSKPIDEQQSARQFLQLIDSLTSSGFEHYEISNFAKPSFHAVHNSNYWKGVSYLGIGPSAHSFNGNTRQWNVAHNMKYLKAIKENNVPFEIEHLTPNDQYNEYVMTGLRTQWGVNTTKIEQWGNDFLDAFLEQAIPFLKEGVLIKNENNYRLSVEGRLRADGIASDLFV